MVGVLGGVVRAEAYIDKETYIKQLESDNLLDNAISLIKKDSSIHPKRGNFVSIIPSPLYTVACPFAIHACPTLGVPSTVFIKLPNERLIIGQIQGKRHVLADKPCFVYVFCVLIYAYVCVSVSCLTNPQGIKFSIHTHTHHSYTYTP